MECRLRHRRMNTSRIVVCGLPGVLRSGGGGPMQTSYRRCCGIDVHKKSVTVHVLPPQGQREVKPLEREFRTFSRDLRRLRGWLKRYQVSEVVMEIDR